MIRYLHYGESMRISPRIRRCSGYWIGWIVR